MKKKLLFNLLLAIQPLIASAQVAQFPQLYYNAQGGGNASLNIRQTASSSGTVITTLSTSAKIGADNSATSTEPNGTAVWARVCLPTTTSGVKYGYLMYGQYYARINETNNYASVTATNLNIRQSAGSASSVTINGSNALYGQSSVVALTGMTSVISGTTWYEVYLPTNCSQAKGWLSGAFLTINSNTTNYQNVAGSVLNTSSVFIWGATITIGSYTTKSTEGFYQYKLPPGWTGSITCTHPSYTSSTPTSYSYTANNHNYTRNFVVNSSCTQPTSQATIGQYTNNTTGSSITANWTRGNGTGGVIVVARLTTTSSVGPSSGASYNANATFSSGSTTGAGNYVVYRGTGTSVNVTGISCGQDYTFTVYEYNTTGTCYKAPGSSSTVSVMSCSCTQPTTQSTIGQYTNNTTGTSLTANWTRGNGTGGVIVVARLNSTLSVVPTSGTSYTANAAFGSGSITGQGNYVVYKGTGINANVTGLTCGQNYTFTVYEYNTTGTCYKIPGSSSSIQTFSCSSNTISGYIKDVSINFTTGTLNNNNTSGFVDLYSSAGTLLSTYAVANNGYYEFNNLSNTTFKLKARKIGNLFTATVEVNNVIPQSNLIIKVPYKLLEDAKQLATELEHKVIDQTYFAGLIYYNYNATAYNESEIKSLLTNRQNLSSNYDNNIEGIARLQIAQKALQEFSNDGAIMTGQFANSLSEIGFSVYNIITLKKLLGNIGPPLFLRNLLRPIAGLTLTLIDNVVSTSLSNIQNDEMRNELKGRLKAVFDAIKRKAETSDPKDYLTSSVKEEVKLMLAQTLTVILFEKLFTSYLTQVNVRISYINANSNNFQGTFNDAFNNIISTTNLSSSVNLIHQQTNQKKTEIEALNTGASIIGYALQIGQAIENLNTQGISSFTSGVSNTVVEACKEVLNISKNLISINKSYEQILNIHYDLLDATQQSFNRTSNTIIPGIVTNYSNNFLSNINSYNSLLTQIVTDISNNARASAIHAINNLLIIDDSIESDIQDNVNYINSTGKYAIQTISNFDSLNFNTLDKLSVSSSLKRKLYCHFMSYYLDSATNNFKDSILNNYQNILNSNSQLVLYFDSVNVLLSNLSLPPQVYITGHKAPQIMAVSNTYPIKIYYKNYTGLAIQGLYCKLNLDTTFSTQIDSFYIGSMDAGANDSLVFNLTAPSFDTLGFCTFYFIDSNNNADVIGIALNSAHIPSAPIINVNNDICIGDSIKLLSNTVFNASYHWNGPSGFVSHLQNPTINDSHLENEGAYSCFVVVNGLQSNATTINVAFDVVPTPTISITNQNDTIVFISSASIGNQWYKDDTLIHGAINQVFKSQDARRYYVQVSNNNGCVSDTSFNVVKPTRFVFNGNGYWDISSNWLNNIIPISSLTQGEEIIIDPVDSGQAILNKLQTIGTGANFTIRPGKKLIVLGDLVITNGFPYLKTSDVTDITFAAAMFNGNVLSDAGHPITSRGFCYSINRNPTLADSTVLSGNGIGVFNSTVVALLANTTYYVRAFATNSVGTGYGNEIRFTTNQGPLHLGQFYAGGIIFYLDSTGERGLVCAPNDQSYMNTNNINYYVKWGCQGMNIAGTSPLLGTGAQNTAAIVAGCTENNIAAKICDSLILNGYDDWYLPSEGELTKLSQNLLPLNVFVSTSSCIDHWSSSQYNVTDAYTTFALNCNNNPPIYNYYRGKSANALVRAVRSFNWASPSIPIIGTKQGTMTTATTASSGGYISSDGGSPVAARGVCWNTTPNPTLLNNFTTDGNGSGFFNSNIAELSGCGTVYYTRAYATNSNGTAYGNQVIVNSGFAPATPLTNSVSEITINSAISGGNVLSDGGCPITSRGVCWSIAPNPTVNNYKTLNGSGLGSFVSNITNLGSDIIYYVRAYATNAIGTVYGQQVVFTTSTPSSLYIGQSYGGGTIFYLDSTGQHGLACAPTDQSYNNGSTTNYYVRWGCQGINISGTNTALGTGAQNTAAIINGCSELNTAARICDELVLNGYSDWFLPSEDELTKVSQNLTPLGLFGSTNPCIDHWSSSQFNSTDGYTTSVSNCNSNPPILNYHRSKGANALVRAVRAF